MLYFIFVVTRVLLSWFATTCRTWFRSLPKPGIWRLLACTTTNRATSQCELVTIFFQACEASRHICYGSVWVGDTESISQRFCPDRGLTPEPSDYYLFVLPLGYFLSQCAVYSMLTMEYPSITSLFQAVKLSFNLRSCYFYIFSEDRSFAIRRFDWLTI